MNELENFRLNLIKKYNLIKFGLIGAFVPLATMFCYFTDIFDTTPLLVIATTVCICLPPFTVASWITVGIYLALFIALAKFKIEILIILMICLSFVLSYYFVVRFTRDKMQRKFSMFFQSTAFEKCSFDCDLYGEIEFDPLIQSGFFKKHYAFYSDMQISGEICGGVKFEFARLGVHDDINGGDFWGIFFHATLEKSVKQATFIVPNEIGFENKKCKKVAINDSEFNKIFSVFGGDTESVAQILTPKFMKRLMQFEKRLISLTDNKIYIFLNTGLGDFEPKFTKSVLRENPFLPLKRQILHCLFITKILNSNL